MKKLVTLCLVLIFAVLNVSAQEQSFLKGDNLASIGIGFGGNLYSGYYGSGIKRIPALSFNYERCVKDNLFDEKSSLGIGGMLGYASASTDYWKSSNVIIGAKGILHYALIENLDTYTGLMLGYDVVSFKWKHSEWGWGGSTSGVTWSYVLGARYFFNESFGAYAELGYGISVFSVGASLKF
jgi:hypothetical protein